MRWSRSFIVAFVLLALAAAPAAARPAFVDTAKAEHARVVAFWTNERIASAKPRDMVPGKTPIAPTAKGGNPNKGKPGGGGGGGGGGTTGDSAPHGTVKNTVGKVFFTSRGWTYVCSGSAIRDGRTDYSLVLTAAHCVYDRGFVSNWIFIPDFESKPFGGLPNSSVCADTQFGCWTAAALVAHSGFTSQRQFNLTAIRHDFAFAVVGAGGKSNTQLDNTVGVFPISFSQYASGTPMSAWGYPAGSPYNGRTLESCNGNIFYDPGTGGTTYGMSCGMTGGSSGGPWFVSFSNGFGTAASVNSYKYTNDATKMYGPKFNSNTQAVFNAANSATSNTIVQ